MELSAIANGGRIAGFNDAHYGDPWVILIPGRGINMGDGWETRRRRETGHDWILVRLGAPGVIDKRERRAVVGLVGVARRRLVLCLLLRPGLRQPEDAYHRHVGEPDYPLVHGISLVDRFGLSQITAPAVKSPSYGRYSLTRTAQE